MKESSFLLILTMTRIKSESKNENGIIGFLQRPHKNHIIKAILMPQRKMAAEKPRKY